MKKMIALLLVLLLLTCCAAAETAETAAPAETEAPAETAASTATEAPEETEEPEEPAFGSPENPVPAGEAYSFTTEMTADGVARVDSAEAPFVTLSMTVTLTESLEQPYYQEKYASAYKLTGTEACAVLEFSMEAAEGVESIIPQDVVLVRMADAEGNIYDGYQMMDSEIGGNYDVELVPGEPRTFYKRYVFNVDLPMQYVVLTTYTGGEEKTVYLLLENPIVYETLEVGAHSTDAVIALQQKLIDMGYLKGKADGWFGEQTKKAIMAVQEEAGMEQTGVADNEFQHYLFD